MTGIPTQVTLRGLPHSDALDSDIREHVAWLQQFYAPIVRCRVLVELHIGIVMMDATSTSASN